MRPKIAIVKACHYCGLLEHDKAGLCRCPHLKRRYRPSSMRFRKPCEHFEWREGTIYVFSLKKAPNNEEIDPSELANYLKKGV